MEVDDVKMNPNYNEVDNDFIDFIENLNQVDKVEKVAILIDEIKNENPNIRLHCIKTLDLVADIIGPERTEEELLPMVQNLILNYEDNEDILSELSNQIYNLSVKFNNFSSNIIKGLEMLAGNDDETVRQSATENLCKIINLLNEENINTEIFPLMQRFIQNDIKSKVSCCYLFPVVYPRLANPKTKFELLQAYFEISKEDSPSVRRSAAFNLRKFAEIGDEKLVKELLPLQVELLRDSVDIVKSYAIESIPEVLGKIAAKDREILTKAFIEAIEKENSWRVRHSAGETLCKITKNFSSEFNEKNIIPSVKTFLKDEEPEVKASILGNIEKVMESISKEAFFSELFPIMSEHLSTDSNYHVRGVFISKVLQMLKYFNSEEIGNRFFPLVSKILKEDIYEVKVNAFNHIDDLLVLLTVDNQDVLNCTVELFTAISKDPKWRIRLNLADKMALVYKNSKDPEAFIKFLWPIVSTFYSDSAFKIREHALGCVIEIVRDLVHRGDAERMREFLDTRVVPLIRDHSVSNSYIFRIFAIKSLEALIKEVFIDYARNELVPFILTFKEDSIPNVRFCLAKAIEEISSRKELIEDSDIRELIVTKTLKEMKEDQDEDVKFYVNRALNSIANQ